MSADSTTSRPPVVVVTGPTASGKTELAIEIAERFDGEVINADSMQIYRELDVGTAKPSLAQRARVPHHMLDVVAPNAQYNAGLYQRDARKVAQDLFARKKLSVLTGGTGLYIRAFLEGLLDTGAPDPELRKSLEEEHERAVAAGDPDRLHRRLQSSDRAAAAKIHPNDARRVIRALELGEQGELASTRRSQHAFRDRPFRAIHFAIDPGREALNERIDERCRLMIESGLLREARALRERGYGAELRPLQAIGYRHMAAVVDGHDTLAHALEQMQRDTRRFARRQRTWLRKVPDVIWHKPEDTQEIFASIEAFLLEPPDGASADERAMESRQASDAANQADR
jgi:tRNA dimethylallyltransferase